MQLVNIHGANDVRLEEVATPEIGEADVLWRVDACGICGSDLTFAKYGMQRQGGGQWPLGHEAAGTDVFIDMAGAAVLLEQTVAMAKFQSRIVLTAVYPQPVALNLEGMLIREMSLKTAVGYPIELSDALDTLGRVDLNDISAYVSHRYDFGDFPQAFETAKDRSSAKVMVVMTH